MLQLIGVTETITEFSVVRTATCVLCKGQWSFETPVEKRPARVHRLGRQLVVSTGRCNISSRRRDGVCFGAAKLQANHLPLNSRKGPAKAGPFFAQSRARPKTRSGSMSVVGRRH